MRTTPSAESSSGRHPAYHRLKADMIAAVEHLRASDFNFSPPPFPIAGFSYYDGDAALPELLPGTALTLRAQPNNPHDPNAVEILHGGWKLGYIPRFCNRRVSQLLNDATPLTCEIARISADAQPWDAVAVRVFVSHPQLLAA